MVWPQHCRAGEAIWPKATAYTSTVGGHSGGLSMADQGYVDCKFNFVGRESQRWIAGGSARLPPTVVEYEPYASF